MQAIPRRKPEINDLQAGMLPLSTTTASKSPTASRRKLVSILARIARLGGAQPRSEPASHQPGDKVTIISNPIDHFQIYYGEYFEKSVKEQIAFLRRHAELTSR